MEEQWRFVCEALVHISSLRLFVSKASGFQCCGEIRNLSARISFCSSGLVLVCEWEESEEKRTRLQVPLPLCALDHSAPVEVLAREDHVEVKLKLLDAGICLLKDPSTAEGRGLKALLSVDSKEQSLSNLYCRACNAELTKGDFKSIVELPSVDWRDIADHWFGICCCGSSIKTETMVARFEQNVAPARGKLLVSSTSCIIHLQDFCEGAVTVAEETCRSVEEQNNGGAWNGGADDQQGLDIDNGTCNSHHCGDHSVQRTRKSLPTSFYDFLRGPIQPLSTGTWQPLHCCQCKSLLGTYDTELMHAVHLFKRSIVASKPSTFRYHTLQKDFLDDLVSQSEDNSSYRFVVRDLVQRTPLVQLVLLNQDALISFGTIESSEAEHRLRPAVSLMFSDCRDHVPDQLRHVEQWSTEQKADDIFMLEEEIHILVDELRANHGFFPESYSVAEGLKMSFLQKL